MMRNPDGTRMNRKERQLAKQKELERAKFEKEYREKTLINKTLRQLKNTYDKYETQKEIFIKMAKEAKERGFTPQYNMARTGLKIILDSQEKASSMYLNLAISNQIKQTVGDTKKFILSMSEISKELSEVNSQIDFVEAQKNYDYAMQEISAMEERLNDFSENISTSLEDYAEFKSEDEKVDKALDMLINGSGKLSAPSVTPVSVAEPLPVADKDKDFISEKMKALDELMKDLK